nr:hypothetical protein [Rathayibacter rathayi]
MRKVERPPIWTGPRRFFHRKCTIFFTTAGGVRAGERCGREDRSNMPAEPISAKRFAHRFVVGHDT